MLLEEEIVEEMKEFVAGMTYEDTPVDEGTTGEEIVWEITGETCSAEAGFAEGKTCSPEPEETGEDTTDTGIDTTISSKDVKGTEKEEVE